MVTLAFDTMTAEAEHAEGLSEGQDSVIQWANFIQSAVSTALQKQSWFCLCASLWEEEFTDVFVWREGQSKEVAIETTLSASRSLRQIMLFSNDSHWSKV